MRLQISEDYELRDADGKKWSDDWTSPSAVSAGGYPR